MKQLYQFFLAGILALVSVPMFATPTEGQMQIETFLLVTPAGPSGRTADTGFMDATGSTPEARSAAVTDDGVTPDPANGLQAEASAAAHPKVSAQSVNGVINAASYPSIQAAVDALPATGGKVEIPAGNYPLSSEILMATTSGKQYQLCGVGPATVLSITGTNGAIHVTGKAGETRSFVKLCGMTISAAASKGTAAFGWHLDGVADFTVENVNVFGGTFDKAQWQTGAQQGEIRGGYIDPGTANTGTGLYQELSGTIASNGTDVHGQSYAHGKYCIYQSHVDDAFIHANHIMACKYGLYIAAGGFGQLSLSPITLRLYPSQESTPLGRRTSTTTCSTQRDPDRQARWMSFVAATARLIEI